MMFLEQKLTNYIFEGALIAGSLLFLVVGCGPSAPVVSQPVVSLTQALGSVECGQDELRGFGIGASEDAALNAARSSLAMQIESSIKVSNEYRQSQQVLGGKENLSSGYESKAIIEATLQNAQDARVHRIERGVSEVGAVLCISRADAAKPYKQSQNLLKDSIEFAALLGLKAIHPKEKSQARDKVNSLWDRMLASQGLLESWGMGGDISKAKGFRDAVEDDYKDYCQNAKLHWNPERENLYSEIAFARLSQKHKIEKSHCGGRGVSLVYKSSENKCEFAGAFKCSHHPSLLVASCEGVEYKLLKGPDVGSFHQKEDVALERLQAKLRDEVFWNEWDREIGEWSPQCE
jgi:hypothetical protein